MLSEDYKNNSDNENSQEKNELVPDYNSRNPEKNFTNLFSLPLHEMPKEIIMEIIKFTDVNTLKSLWEVNKFFRVFVNKSIEEETKKLNAGKPGNGDIFTYLAFKKFVKSNPDFAKDFDIKQWCNYFRNVESAHHPFDYEKFLSEYFYKKECLHFFELFYYAFTNKNYELGKEIIINNSYLTADLKKELLEHTVIKNGDFFNKIALNVQINDAFIKDDINKLKELVRVGEYFSLEIYQQQFLNTKNECYKFLESLIKFNKNTEKFAENILDDEKENVYFINIQNYDGYSALHNACNNRNLPLVKKLIARGANVNLKAFDDKFNTTPLLIAASNYSKGNSNAEIIEELIKANADINSRSGYTRQNALHLACYHGDKETVKALLKSPKIDINARDYQGETPLITLCSAKGVRFNIESLKVLVEVKGINFFAKDNDGNTAFDYLVFNRFVQAEKILEDKMLPIYNQKYGTNLTKLPRKIFQKMVTEERNKKDSAPERQIA